MDGWGQNRENAFYNIDPTTHRLMSGRSATELRLTVSRTGCALTRERL